MTDAGDAEGQPVELAYWWAPRGDDRVFDLQTWPDEARATAQALLDEEGVTYRWEGRDLVVDAGAREDVAGILDEVVAANRPRLDLESNRTAYELGDWPDYEVETLQTALDDEGILHEWTEEGDLLVYEVDEARVDELFERLDLRGPDPGIELDGEALTNLLTTLFTASDRLARDAANADGVLDAHRSILELQQLAVPYGIPPDGWEALVADATELRRLLEAEAEGDDDDPASDEAVNEVAGRVRDRLRRML
jgi:hypothetical protein